jgi:hypothetical protein
MSKPGFKIPPIGGLGGLGAGLGEGDGDENLNKSPVPSMVPSLDFRKMKVVKETDWYTQTKKLEEVIKNLRDKVTKLEKSLEEADT